MPNRPDDPYGRLPLMTMIGVALMVAGGVALLFLSATWHDWRQAAFGALLLVALIGLALALRRVKLRPFLQWRPKAGPLPEPATAAAPDHEPEPFDPAGFIEAARSRHPAPRPRQIEERRRQEEASGSTAAPARKAVSAETIRRLQDLRDHPATPEPERQAADQKVKTLRNKRRSAWSKRP